MTTKLMIRISASHFEHRSANGVRLANNYGSSSINAVAIADGSSTSLWPNVLSSNRDGSPFA
jgi:hypothetical protein